MSTGASRLMTPEEIAYIVYGLPLVFQNSIIEDLKDIRINDPNVVTLFRTNIHARLQPYLIPTPIASIMQQQRNRRY